MRNLNNAAYTHIQGQERRPGHERSRTGRERMGEEQRKHAG